MKSKDQIKEEIGVYKLLMTMSSAITSSLIGWLFGKYSIITTESILVFVVMTVFLTATVFFLVKTYSKIKELAYE
jgi:hypothetical protein